MSGIFWLHPNLEPDAFPDVELALDEPNGLLAAGGDLSPQRILAAYRLGIFPWYSDGEPILWWSPDPRAVLFPESIKISRSLKKTLNKKLFDVRLDTAFDQVIRACAQPRKDGAGTWITGPMYETYCQLHRDGFAHSVECWQNGRLVGGLYGLALGKVFFGESMFSLVTDASKVALVHLVWQLKRWRFGMIDCQVTSSHLASLGATDIPRREFIQLLNRWVNEPGQPGAWHFDNQTETEENPHV
jgi:leucyl/phenylalanyl-tRNA--protein transferase